MDSKNLLEDIDITRRKEKIGTDDYLEIQIPYSLYQFLNSEHCNVQNICRICLATDSVILYPLVATKENNILANMFTVLTTIQLLPDDGLPANICESCQTQVVQCYEFKIKCEKSDCMLKSILKGEFITKEELTDPSMVVKQEDSNINENNNISEIDTFNTTDEMVIKEETEILEDVEYLENLSDNPSDSDNIFIVQHTRKKRKKKYGHDESNKLLKSEKLSKKKLGRKARKKENSFPCDICSKVFYSVKTFHAHMKSKHPSTKNPHTCALCPDSFESEHDLIVHASLHIAEGNSWKCNQCLKEFISKSMLRRHISRHMQSKRYACDSCGKAFTEMYALRRHARVHTGELVEKKHACTLCDKRYSESGLLAAHMSRHIGLRPCECSTCGKRFSSQRLLASHRLVHSDRKPYACSYCDKRFRHESTRNTHHRTHTGEKPYVCSFCGKSFIQNSNLTLHLRTHTGERPYACTMCDRKFTSGSSLKSHERVHSGERPYSCNICGKRFTRKNLTVHMQLHTGERPHQCSFCYKKFSSSSRLRDHHRVHTGEKPFDCTMCTVKFATKSQLLKHSKSHQTKKKKKSENRELVFVEHVETVPVITDGNVFNEEHGELITVSENVSTVESPENQSKELTLNIVQEVPLEVTGELVLQDDSNIKAEVLVVDNSQNNNYQGDICLNTI